MLPVGKLLQNGVVSRQLPFPGVRFGLIELVAGALGNVALGRGLVEATAAVRTLHVVRVLRWRRRGQVA
jgi:hypothetical protein